MIGRCCHCRRCCCRHCLSVVPHCPWEALRLAVDRSNKETFERPRPLVTLLRQVASRLSKRSLASESDPRIVYLSSFSDFRSWIIWFGGLFHCSLVLEDCGTGRSSHLEELVHFRGRLSSLPADPASNFRRDRIWPENSNQGIQILRPWKFSIDDFESTLCYDFRWCEECLRHGLRRLNTHAFH